MDDLAGYIDYAVKEAIGSTYDKALEQAHKDALAKRDEVIAVTALQLSSYYSMQDMGNSLRIEIVKTAPRSTKGDK